MDVYGKKRTPGKATASKCRTRRQYASRASGRCIRRETICDPIFNDRHPASRPSAARVECRLFRLVLLGLEGQILPARLADQAMGGVLRRRVSNRRTQCAVLLLAHRGCRESMDSPDAE